MFKRTIGTLLNEIDWSKPRTPRPAIETFATPKAVADFEKYLIDTVNEIVPGLENFSSKKSGRKVTFFWDDKQNRKVFKLTIYYATDKTEIQHYAAMLYFKHGKRFEGLDYDKEFKVKVVAW